MDGSNGRWCHRIFFGDIRRYLQVEGRIFRRSVFQHRFVVAAEAIVEAAIFFRRRIQRDPCGEQYIGITGGEIEIILMHRLGAVTSGGLQKPD